MRLDGFLSAAGFTRRQAKAAVADGRVSVDGVFAKDPGLRLSGNERVALDGALVKDAKDLHLMMYKPEGYVTAREDARAPAVMELIPESLRKRGLGPVGRLDKDVTGLLLLTSDGQLAHRLISPKRRVEKRYRATVEGRLTGGDIQRMREGIELRDFVCLPANLDILSAENGFSCAELSIFEGKYHQVKRMFSAIGHPVTVLHRLSIGGVSLDPALAPGGFRPLTREEERRLYTLTGLSEEL